MHSTQYKNSSKTLDAYSALDDEYVISMVMILNKIQAMHFHRENNRLLVYFHTFVV
jgi:hypothetical protein